MFQKMVLQIENLFLLEKILCNHSNNVVHMCKSAQAQKCVSVYIDRVSYFSLIPKNMFLVLSYKIKSLFIVE